jgi:hypothetical protein
MSEELRVAIQEAKKIADDQPEVYRVVVFEAALKHLLGTPPVQAQQGNASRQGREITMELNEFLAGRKVDSHPDRVLAIAYYQYRKNSGGLTTKDFMEAYARTRVRKPQNIHDVIAKNIRRGFLVDTDKKDGMRAWLITPSGEHYVETELSQ